MTSVANKVNNSGVLTSDIIAVATDRGYAAAMEFGGDQGIVAYGYATGNVNMSNIILNYGVVGSDVTGVGTARMELAGCGTGQS